MESCHQVFHAQQGGIVKIDNIKDGMRVRDIESGKLGCSFGPVYHFSVWWIIVKWDDAGFQYVLEQCLEII